MFSSETGDSEAPVDAAQQQRMQNKMSKIDVISRDRIGENNIVNERVLFVRGKKWMRIIETISL